MSSSKCLAIFFAFTTRPARRPIAAAVRRRPRSTAAATCASASSVAARSASRLRARSAARTGLRQTTRRSPGNSGLVISARSRSSNNPSWRSPASTSRRIAGARRQLTQPIPPVSLRRAMRADVSIPRSPTRTSSVRPKRVRSFSTWASTVAGSAVLPGNASTATGSPASVSRPNSICGRSGRWSREWP